MEHEARVTCPQCLEAIRVSGATEGVVACPRCGTELALHRPSPSEPPMIVGQRLPRSEAVSGPWPVGPKPTAPPEPITNLMARHLAGTRPWVLFLAILGFIGCGLGFVAMMVLWGTSSGMAPLPVLLTLIILLIYLIPLGHLYRYGSCIGRFLHTGRSRDMEEALEAQRSFWRFVGVLTIVVLCLYVVFLLLLVSRR